MRAFAHRRNQSQKKTSSGIIRSNTATSAPIGHVHPMLHLQRTIGNQALMQLLGRNAKGTPGDVSAASQGALPRPITRLSEATIQRQRREQPRTQQQGQGLGQVPHPRPFNPPEGIWVLVSLRSLDGGAGGHGLVRVYDGTTLLHRFPASGGRSGHTTPVGEFLIDLRDLPHRSSEYGKCVPVPQPGERRRRRPRSVTTGSDACRPDERYQGADMRFFQRFAPKVGFHRGNPSEVSHGCIHLENDDASTLWGAISERTRVVVCSGERCQWYVDGILAERAEEAAARRRESPERNERERGGRRRQ